MTAPHPPLLVLLGPTASGKESAAVRAAERLDAEIVACDSVKPYRGLGIASAAPPAEHAERVRHHVVGVLDPRERIHAARWLELAEEAFADIRRRGKRPLVVGGTALYLKALLFGLFEGPPANPELRAELNAVEDAEPGALHRRLREVDPIAADRIHANDRKRLLRALEVFTTTGQPISARQQQWKQTPARPHVAVGLRRTRDDVRDRIERRVDAMLAAGLVDEVLALTAPGALGPTASEAIGVKELLPVLRAEAEIGWRDETALAAAIEQIRSHTRLLARRQRTWWKQFPSVNWLDVAPEETADEVGARVADAFLEPSDA